MSERRRRGIGLPRRRRRALAACAAGGALLGASAFGLTLGSSPAPARADDPVRARMLDLTTRYMQSQQHRDGCYPMKPGGASDPIAATPWTALAIASAGVNPREQFTPDGDATAWDCIVRAARDLTVTTDFERTLLVAVAACTDPRRFAGGIDLVAAILAARREGGSFDRVPGGRALSSPVNTTIFAVLALAAVGDPALAPAIRDGADWILGAQNADGSWPATTVGARGDADMTGAALEALRAAGRAGPAAAASDEPAAAAVTSALAWLRVQQLADGGFPTFTDTIGNAGSTAWVAQGLWALDDDPGRWRPRDGGPTILGFLESMQQLDGHIRWKATSDDNPVWMTAYTLPAYAGRYLPFGCVEPSGRVPAPRDAPSPDQPSDGVGGGSGGTGGDGGGVVNGGGRGAPNFSRPRPGSKGSTVGGVRATHVEQRRRRRARTQAEQERARAAPAETERPDAARPDRSLPRREGGDAAPADADARRGRDGADAGARRGRGGSSRRGAGDGRGADDPRPPAPASAADEQVAGRVIGEQGAPGDG